jgi:hypothetical protein
MVPTGINPCPPRTYPQALSKSNEKGENKSPRAAAIATGIVVLETPADAALVPWP